MERSCDSSEERQAERNGVPSGPGGGPSWEVLDAEASLGTEGIRFRRRKRASVKAKWFPRKSLAPAGRIGQVTRAAEAPPPVAASRLPRLPGTNPTTSHLGLKSWKRPLRFMAENFTAVASSSPHPPRHADCALQWDHGARASRVPTASGVLRNLSCRLSPLLLGFRTATAHAPRPRPAGPRKRYGSPTTPRPRPPSPRGEQGS